MKNIYAIWLLLCFTAVSAFSQNERFKSLFVYNFTKNIEWPTGYRQGDFVITVLGNSTIFPELLQNVKGKQSGNQNIRISQAANISGIEKCNMLYIPAQQSYLLESARKHLAGKPTVIISEKGGMMKQGADINIIQQNGRFQFEINPKQLTDKNLTVSKALLNLGITYDSGSIRKTPELESVDDGGIPK